MSNEYYAVTGNPATSSQGSSALMRTEYSLIAAGFDKLPVMTGNSNQIVFINPSAAALTSTSGLTYDGASLGSGKVNLTASNTAATITGNVVTQFPNVVRRTLTPAAAINWNVANGVVGTVTLNQNATISASNICSGTAVLEVTQDGTGSRLANFNTTIFKFESANPPTLTTTAGAKDILTFWGDGSTLNFMGIKRNLS